MANFEVFIDYSEGESHTDDIEVTIKGTGFRGKDEGRELFTRVCLRVVNFFKEDLLVIEQSEGENDDET